MIFAYDEYDESFDNLNGLANQIVKCETPQECIDKSDISAIMHPDNKFSSLDVKGKTIIDYWGIVNGN